MNKFDRNLHIYASEFSHEDVWVVGNAEALRALRDAIDQALAGGSSVCTAFTNDGEGYNTLVINEDDKDTFDSLVLPYYSKSNIFHSGKWPIEVCGDNRYKELCAQAREPVQTEGKVIRISYGTPGIHPVTTEVISDDGYLKRAGDMMTAALKAGVKKDEEG